MFSRAYYVHIIQIYMTFFFYGNAGALIENFSRLMKQHSVDFKNFENNWECFLPDGEIIIVKYNAIQDKSRLCFFTQSCNEAYQITTNYHDDNIIHRILTDITISFTPEEMEKLKSSMPLLNQYSEHINTPLNKYAIIWRDHFLLDNLCLLKSFVKCGIKPKNILALDKGDSTIYQAEIQKTLEIMGINVASMNNNKITEEDQLKYGLLLDNFLDNHKELDVVIIDDGGFIINMLPKQKYINIKAVIELTEIGLRRIESMKTISYPIIDLAKSDLKRNITYTSIAHSIIFRISQLLIYEKFFGSTVLVLGYGDLGFAVCDILRHYGCRIVVVDPDYQKLLMAAEKGYKTYNDSLQAVKTEKPFLLLGMSGRESISLEMVHSMPNNSFITAGATADLSVMQAIEEFKQSVIERYGILYNLEGKRITLLGDGRSINLFYSDSIPNKANDIFITAIFLCTIESFRQHLPAIGLNTNITNNLLQNHSIYKEYYNMYYK